MAFGLFLTMCLLALLRFLLLHIVMVRVYSEQAVHHRFLSIAKISVEPRPAVFVLFAGLLTVVVSAQKPLLLALLNM
jgi:hypothetical protein